MFVDFINFCNGIWRVLRRFDEDKDIMTTWDIDQMKPLSATVVLFFFIHSELSPFYGIIREDDKIFALDT